MRVLVFGTFDPLHPGHFSFFRQAAELGDQLIVVVARDEWIKANKHRNSYQEENERLLKVRAREEVTEAQLGDKWPCGDPFNLLSLLQFEIIALGYDQAPADEVVVAELKQRGKNKVRVVRLKPYLPKLYNSTNLRSD